MSTLPLTQDQDHAYRIAPIGTKFRMVETASDGSVTSMGLFVSGGDAQLWLDNHLRLKARNRGVSGLLCKRAAGSLIALSVR